jgi:hypothetical protein
MSVQAFPRTPFEVVVAEFFLELLMRLFADPPRLDGTGQLLDRRAGGQVREVVLALARRAMFADLLTRQVLGAHVVELPLQFAVIAGELALQGQRFLLHPLGVSKHRFAFVGRAKAARRALEQRAAAHLFERVQPPTRRRLTEAKLGRCRSQRTGTGDTEEQAQVISVEAGIVHAAMHSRRSELSVADQR